MSLKNNFKKYLTVHRLVAKTFLENSNNLPCINHKNEIKTDNRVKNLEWCSKAYNNFYNDKIVKSCKSIIQYDINGNFIKEWISAREVYRILKIQYKNISKCCKGERKTAGGYIWKFKEEKYDSNTKTNKI